jgi:dephospho-CoA kinase
MIIGLTGGIGSGKSTVGRIFETFPNVVRFDEDIAAHECYSEPEVKEQIIRVLGPEAYSGDEKLNRKFVADKIFNDNNIRNQINNIFGPAIQTKFEDFVDLNLNQKLSSWNQLCYLKHTELIHYMQLLP